MYFVIAARRQASILECPPLGDTAGLVSASLAFTLCLWTAEMRIVLSAAAAASVFVVLSRCPIALLPHDSGGIWDTASHSDLRRVYLGELRLPV